jgi:hypothetical protein
MSFSPNFFASPTPLSPYSLVPSQIPIDPNLNTPIPIFYSSNIATDEFTLQQRIQQPIAQNKFSNTFFNQNVQSQKVLKEFQSIKELFEKSDKRLDDFHNTLQKIESLIKRDINPFRCPLNIAVYTNKSLNESIKEVSSCATINQQPLTIQISAFVNFIFFEPLNFTRGNVNKIFSLYEQYILSNSTQTGYQAIRTFAFPNSSNTSPSSNNTLPPPFVPYPLPSSKGASNPAFSVHTTNQQFSMIPSHYCDPISNKPPINLPPPHRDTPWNSRSPYINSSTMPQFSLVSTPTPSYSINNATPIPHINLPPPISDNPTPMRSNVSSNSLNQQQEIPPLVSFSQNSFSQFDLTSFPINIDFFNESNASSAHQPVCKDSLDQADVNKEKDNIEWTYDNPTSDPVSNDNEETEEEIEKSKIEKAPKRKQRESLLQKRRLKITQAWNKLKGIDKNKNTQGYIEQADKLLNLYKKQSLLRSSRDKERDGQLNRNETQISNLRKRLEDKRRKVRRLKDQIKKLGK